MKKALLVLIPLWLTACTHVVRETPAAMIADPGGTSTLTTSMSYDDAYRKTYQQMKSCNEMSGAYMTSFNVSGDRNEKDAVISWGLNGILGHRVGASIRLAPAGTGTRIDIFAASPGLSANMMSKIDYWLNQNGSLCDLPQDR